MAAPEVVGRYELLRPLGAGGMGEVFLARDHTLDRLVAIKRVNAHNAASAKSILHEARIVAALDHPNIASVFDVVEHASQPHVVMEFVEGPTLSTRLLGGALPEGDVIAYGRQIADALAYAHARNVVHCDIKPSNVILTPADVPKVLDFGIARRGTPSGDGITTTGYIRGTPAYMAPEVMSGSAPTHQSDVFSLGVLLYELAVGRRPTGGRAQLDALTSRVSPDLSTLITRAIETDPETRLRSAEEFRIGLSRIAAATTETSIPAAPKSTAAAGKTAALLAGFAVVCLALIAGVLGLSPTTTTTPAVLGVMMFNNTGEAENDYLAAGMSDVLISHLADAPGVTLVPRSAMPSLANESQVLEAVKALGLTHLLTGSVQRSGASLRMVISLLAEQGAKVAWSQTFDGTVVDVFHLEQRVGEASLTALRSNGLVSTATVQQARGRPPTSDADAFDDYAHGRALLERADVPGNVDRALTFFESATKRDPSYVRAHAALEEAAWAKFRATRDASWIDRARTATLEALRREPTDPSVLYSLAVIDHGTGRIDDAISGLERLLSQQPASDEAHRLLGRIYEERSDYERAIEELREADRIRPNYPLTIRALGVAYLDRGSLNEAIATFTRLTSLQPDNASAFQLLGASYHSAGELDRALVAYERANELTPRAAAFSNIGVIHHTRGEYALAVDAYRKAIGLQGKEPTTHRNLADALWMTGDRAAARDEYSAALTLANDALLINPANARIQALAAYCEARLGRFVQARTAIARATALAQDDNDVAYKNAVIALLDGQRNEALRLLKRAIELGYNKAKFAADRDLDPLRNDPEFERLSR